jgi:hypothetical protein
MQQWINDPKNRPIVYGIAGCVMVAAIIFICFEFGVIGQQDQAYVPPSSTVATVPTTPLSVAPPISGAAVPASATPGTTAVATVPEVSAAPNARKDPFAPYIDITKFLKELFSNAIVRPQVDTFAPPLTITTYTPPSTQTQTAANGPEQSTPPAGAIGRVSGVMVGTGAYAIVDNNTYQPGDQLPNGAGELTSIQSDSITVKVNGQYIKVPITAGTDTGTQGLAPGPGPGPTSNPYGPGPQPAAPPPSGQRTAAPTMQQLLGQ